jgi:formate/nitrite transporter FocA (FNT family)
MLRKLMPAISAGVLIAIGGCVYLNCDNKYVGAFLFAVALLGICSRGYALFTGKVGYLVEDHSPRAISSLGCALLGNALSTIPLGFLIRAAMPHLGTAAYEICSRKLDQLPLATLVRAVFCGVLMYLAVSIYREKNTIAGIVYCVPVFILSGFEHSIANMFYFGAAGLLDLQVISYLLIVILGNALGGMLLPLLDQLGKESAHV